MKPYTISRPIGFVMMFVASIMWLRNWQLNFENADLKKKIQKLEEKVKNDEISLKKMQEIAPVQRDSTFPKL
jgi:cytochrome oxidase assembly protein ShyY1